VGLWRLQTGGALPVRGEEGALERLKGRKGFERTQSNVGELRCEGANGVKQISSPFCLSAWQHMKRRRKREEREEGDRGRTIQILIFLISPTRQMDLPSAPATPPARTCRAIRPQPPCYTVAISYWILEGARSIHP
jgi:hypothetical protein